MEIEDQPTFSVDLLRVYYSRLFPYEPMCDWLGYRARGAKRSDEDSESVLGRREFSFTLEDDIYIRYQCFGDADAMKTAMKTRMPVKIDIGAVFNVSPVEHVRAKKFTPVERELVFDVDMNDYDDVRTCCVGAKTCRKCWGFMCMAVRVVDAALKDDFGYEHVLWVYSGRRGVHCWVCDRGARDLTNEARSAVVSYLSLVHGNAETNAKKVSLTWPLHPALHRAYDLLEPLFVRYVIGEGGQKLLADAEHWGPLLKTLPDGVGDKIASHWESHPSTPEAKWEALKSLSNVKAPTSSAKKQKLPTVSELWKYETVFLHCYPRLDEHVSKQRNHLLKSPFAVHPKTGRVCVPFDAAQCEGFDPTAVATVKQLAAEIDASGDGGTSLDGSVKFFQQKFLWPLQNALAKQKRDVKEQDAADAGEF
ncbi:hypothetical protein M885DRAFT_485379 [Pelagophyceae sp. CCMP2097]|nr:hypothetical protein M885DRAFT_485379 [Pelagophyceae sp. CCMP2097]